MRRKGIFVKTFIYTSIFVVLLVAVTAVLFSQQFMSFYRAAETREIVNSYHPLVERIQNRDTTGIAEIAARFYGNNESFEFSIVDKGGRVLFATTNAETQAGFNSDFFYVVHSEADFSIIAQSKTGLETFYRDLAVRVVAVFAVMLVLCFVGAYVFAQKVTKPVISGLEDEILQRQQMEETRRYFFSAASHELKTPVAAASVLLEGMIEDVGDYKEHPKYLRECLKLMDAQSELLSEILEIVALSDGNIAPVSEKLDVATTVAEVLADYQTLAEANGQRLTVEIPSGQFCLADPRMLKRTVSNVVLNAVQNTPAGGEIRIWSEPAEKRHRLCVLNTGARIDAEALPKLFDSFYRIDKARNRKDGRSGLGLTIVQKTLAAMDIPFALENSSDGVLFWMDLPDLPEEPFRD